MEIEETGSGARNGRPGISQVMNAARNRAIDAVIAKPCALNRLRGGEQTGPATRVPHPRGPVANEPCGLHAIWHLGMNRDQADR